MKNLNKIILGAVFAAHIVGGSVCVAVGPNDYTVSYYDPYLGRVVVSNGTPAEQARQAWVEERKDFDRLREEQEELEKEQEQKRVEKLKRHIKRDRFIRQGYTKNETLEFVPRESDSDTDSDEDLGYSDSENDRTLDEINRDWNEYYQDAPSPSRCSLQRMMIAVLSFLHV
ncbi:hypothetical protein K2W90_06450 [Candidatus Babeliales bacterium]|nr:hypothetical protein [Candidatus Babeliales bacterium]